MSGISNYLYSSGSRAITGLSNLCQRNWEKILVSSSIVCGAMLIKFSGQWDPTSCLGQYGECVAVYNRFAEADGLPVQSSYGACYSNFCSETTIQSAQLKFLAGAFSTGSGIFSTGIALLKRCL